MYQGGEGNSERNSGALGAYANYLLKHKQKEFTAYLICLYSDSDGGHKKIKDFKAYSRDQIVQLLPAATENFLRHAAKNGLHKLIYPASSVVAEGILLSVKGGEINPETLSYEIYIIKNALLHFISAFTNKPDEIIGLAKEIEEYCFFIQTDFIFTGNPEKKENRPQSHSALHGSREKFLETLTVAQIGTFDWDLTGKGRSQFSEQVYRIFETDRFSSLEELFEKIHPGDKEKVLQAIEKAIREEGDFECEYRYDSKSGRKLVWLRGKVIREDGMPAFLTGTVMDITERQNTLHKLERNERLYKQAQSLAHIGNWTYEIDTESLDCSDELYRILGFSPDKKSELTLETFFVRIHPDDVSLVEQKFFELAKGLSVEDTVVRIVGGEQIKYIRGNGQVLKDEKGKPYKVIGTCQDITKEMKLQNELMEREDLLEKLNLSLNEKNLHLERSNKELSAFGYVVSHDLQEPLRKIRLFGELLLDKESGRFSEEGKMLLERMIKSSSRMQKLINDLLSFSRTQTGDKTFEKVNLNTVVDSVMNFYHESVNKKKPHITRTELPVIDGITFQVQQIFENIISNSVKYSKSENNIRVNITGAVVEEDSIKGKTKYYKISVSDNGIGFEQKYASKIFEIFQRLHGKAEYSGTGIGLAICKRIIDNHSGKIEAKGVPGEGATFDIYFPVND